MCQVDPEPLPFEVTRIRQLLQERAIRSDISEK